MKHKIIQRQSLWLTFLLLVVFFVVPLTNAQANVTIITPADYELANLQVGDEYYLDRTYTLTSVPSELTEGEEEWIKTKKKDKANTSVSFLEFTISQDSTIYIGYDPCATSPPDWLTSKFVSTPLIIGVSEEMGHFDVYKQNFSAGTITLGGNLASGAVGAKSNYIVIVKPYTPVPEICDNGIDDDLDSLIDCSDTDCSLDPACQTWTCTDADSDNYYAQSDCGTAVDCDDNDPAVNPGADEVCNDNKDNDCDGAVDCSDTDCSSNLACQTCTDADSDSYYAESGCETAVDCDDNDPAVNPGADEVCDDNKDNDCDGDVDCSDADCSADPACQTCTDADSDGYYAQSDCGTAVDCDDNDSAVNPGADEVCDDNKDNDCDGAVDCSDTDCQEDIACLDNVTILNSADYEISNLQVGDEYYLDRTYTLTSVPSELTEGEEEWIKTKNNDKANTSVSFLEFTISQDSTIYIGYDTRATSPPDWLTSKFVSTPLIIGVSEEMGHFDVYKQNFSAGTIVLGGNLASGAAGAKSNYNVIVKPYTPVPEICDNGIDDDLDSLIDCADADCSADPACQTCTDADSDGYYAQSDCGTAVDCDDNDSAVNPGADEVCDDNKDNDCDGAVDCSDTDCSLDPACQTCTDADSDGYYAQSDCGTAVDCDDNDSAVNPGADEVCDDNKDNDCDGAVDCSDTDCSLDPACLDNVTILNPADYEIANLQVGDEFFLDRTYTLTSVPSELTEGEEVWIKTKNNDKANTSDSFLEFTISQDSTNYIGYDTRATSPPDWLTSKFVSTPLIIGVSEEMGHFDVYKQNFSAGTIVLGGNLASGAAGAKSNHIVIVKPYTPVPEICDNGIDDDLDSLVDCSDADCSADPACQTCTDADSDGYYAQSDCGTAVDCDDNDSAVNPGADEVCDDNKDNDCDGDVDCSDADCSLDPVCQTCTDADSDGYYAQSDCGTAVDCDDNDPAVNPGAVEVCDDNKDNDCDGAVDCSDADCSADPVCQTCTDADSDGYYAQSDCGTAVDCDDNDSAVNPGAVEVCDDNKDNDCDGDVDCSDADCSADPVCQGVEIFSDDFNDGNADGWISVDEGDGTSTWQVINGEYHQLSLVTTLTESYHLGTFSYLSDWTLLTDYRFSITIKPTPDSFGRDVGVMFRYQDPDNYYRLSFNSQYGYTRLEKRVNGIFTTLVRNARGYKQGEVLNILIEVSSNKILVYVNNDALFSVVDADLLSGTVALYCENNAIFDDAYIQTNNTSPTIVISEPTSYSVEVSNDLSASAIALNAPQAGTVEFLLDGSNQIIAGQTSPGYYTGQFYSVSQGDHTIDAILKDSGGNEVARDTNTVIGILGDSYYTIGNSITNGHGDYFASDNISLDERLISFSGYHAMLNDLLTTSLSYPHIFSNEGVGGDETLDALGRVDSIIERHQGSNKVLILLGTNDSAGTLPVDSGLGCIGNDCDGTFKGNMITLIDKIVYTGFIENVTVGLVPPVFGSGDIPFSDPLSALRNSLIHDYNNVIKNELANVDVVPPDFFGFFIDKFSLFIDNLHPNALGYVVMSHLWSDPTENSLPFLLEDLIPSRPSDYPSTYKQNLLEIGNKYYIDRSYILTSIPNILKHGIWVMTANNDKNIISENHVSFFVDRPCTVYIAYDSRATSLPDWMGDFNDTATVIETTDVDFNVYSKPYVGGSTIQLGGNKAPGASGAGSNYIVIVVEN